MPGRATRHGLESCVAPSPSGFDTFGIGDDLNFDDDGPFANFVDGGGDVTVDETAGLQDDDTADAGVAALFAGVASPGSDGAAFPQFAESGTPLVDVSGSDPGEDDEGATTVISLEIVGGDNTDSLLDTTDGTSIFLFKEGDLIVGRIGGALGDAAFAVAIQQDGDAALAQYVSLTHLIFPNVFDHTVDLAGLVNAVVTVTDGDVDTDTFGIGDDLNFDDDGPSLADPNNTVVAFVDSTATDAVDNDVAEPGVELDGDDEVAIVFDPGADGFGSLVITDFTEPDDAGDLAASNLDELEAVLGDITAMSTDTSVTYFTNGGADELFKLTLDTTDPEGYEFQVLQDATSSIHAGPKTEAARRS